MIKLNQHSANDGRVPNAYCDDCNIPCEATPIISGSILKEEVRIMRCPSCGDTQQFRCSDDGEWFVND